MCKRTIAELPDKRAATIGLKRVSNGYGIAWLVDGDGNEYRPPLWLLDLISTARAEGYCEAQRDIRRLIGCPAP